MMTRVFLTRLEATYRLGLADAAQPVQPNRADLRVAIRLPDGTVHEAREGEYLHADVELRVWRERGKYLANVEAGWTIDEGGEES